MASRRRGRTTAATVFAAVLVAAFGVSVLMRAADNSGWNRSSAASRNLVVQSLFGLLGSEGVPWTVATSTATDPDAGSSSNSENEQGPLPDSTPPASTLTTFCAIADAPYTSQEEVELENQLVDLPAECEFLIHLGDLKAGSAACDSNTFGDVVRILEESPALPLVVVGDNDFTDCQDKYDALGLFRQLFVDFENDPRWDHDLSIIRKDPQLELFYFVHKRTLFIGVNVVGGKGHERDPDEWYARLDLCANFTIDTMRENILDNEKADAVVLFAHARPGSKHNDFFDPVLDFLSNSLADETPLLLLHGDGHAWDYERTWKGKNNLLRIQHKGGTSEPPLIMFVDSSGGRVAEETFSYDRRL